MRFLLYVISVFLPVLAFIFGLLVSLTPYPDKDEVAERTLRWSSIDFIVQLILRFYCWVYLCDSLIKKGRKENE